MLSGGSFEFFTFALIGEFSAATQFGASRISRAELILHRASAGMSSPELQFQVPRMAPKFDEMNRNDGSIRPHYGKIARWLAKTPAELLAFCREKAELLFRRIGITFAVYGDKDAAERLIPFDIIPRIIGRSEWAKLEAAPAQRGKA